MLQCSASEVALFPGSPHVQMKSRFSLLQATESWAGHVNEATSEVQLQNYLPEML